jgi:hypothetical protein
LIPIDPDVPTYEAAFTFVVITFVVVIELEMEMSVLDQPRAFATSTAIVTAPVLSVLVRFIELPEMLPKVVMVFEAYRFPWTYRAVPEGDVVAIPSVPNIDATFIVAVFTLVAKTFVVVTEFDATTFPRTPIPAPIALVPRLIAGI